MSEDLNQASTVITRFVSCCDGTEILFRGSTGLETGSIYTYIGATPYLGTGGELIPGQCYTFFRETTTDVVTYPTTPTAAGFDLTGQGGCDDPESCAECDPLPFCECPEGFTYNTETDQCERILETIAEYTGELLPIVAGNKNTNYCKFGVRLYPDISSLIWPILGSGPPATYTLNEDNGIGPAVIATDTVSNEAFGTNVVGCSTGLSGGRLNKAGIWATGFPDNEELSFEFCVDIPGPQTKQYLIGAAGDNKIKFYIDGTLAVFLDANASNPVPFNYWHTFPITLTPGIHTIKLTGVNLGSSAAFASEIYDITLAQFQANLLSPAIGAGNCGSTEAQLEPYIIFSTRDYIGQSVPDPENPGVYSCPDGSEVDYCQGVPLCKITESVPLECDCYLIIPCDGTEPFVSIDESYAPYESTFVEVSGPEYTGCAYVVLTDTEYCNDTTTTTVPTGVVCDCSLRCWFVQNSNGFSIVDENDQFTTISAIDASPNIRICSKIPPVPEAGTDLSIYSAIEIGNCEINDDLAECPELCFLLTECETGDVITSNSDVLYQYAFTGTNVVEILGREGCWEVSLADPDVDPCDCLIDVTVVRSYDECDDCIKSIYYKLTSCEGGGVIYSSLNLEAFVGQVIKTDCGCYKVELIDYKPPNFQAIKLEGLYDNCTSCTRTYYELVDCAGIADNIYTYTDLSLLVGKVINVENCDECWTVNLVENPESIYAGAGIVVVTEIHADCLACEEDHVCTCSQVTNYSDVITKNYQYIDCDGETQSIALGPHESSGRICILKWLPGLCECITLTDATERVPVTYVFTIVGSNEYGPIYENQGTGAQILFTGKIWQLLFNGVYYELDGGGSASDCPIGTWENNQDIFTEECVGPEPGIDTDYFETFGECKHGVCPPRTFPNKRVVTPGYNTPICTPEKYDMITCNFADVMYKIVLEKRYGITNCCPEDDRKWMVKKELIDLQALKDPDYKCSECDCNDHSSNNCLTCKSGN